MDDWNEYYRSQHRFKDGMSLKEYIEYLLGLGKRSMDPDFQLLMRVFGKDKIVRMAKEALAKEEDKENGPRPP